MTTRGYSVLEFLCRGQHGYKKQKFYFGGYLGTSMSLVVRYVGRKYKGYGFNLYFDDVSHMEDFLEEVSGGSFQRRITGRNGEPLKEK